MAERTRQAIAEAGGFKFSTSTLKEKREYEKVMKAEMRDIKQRRRTGGAGRREGKAAGRGANVEQRGNPRGKAARKGV